MTVVKPASPQRSWLVEPKRLEWSPLLLHPQGWQWRHGEAHWAAEGRGAEPPCHLWREAWHRCREGPPSGAGSLNLYQMTLRCHDCFRSIRIKNSDFFAVKIRVCIFWQRTRAAEVQWDDGVSGSRGQQGEGLGLLLQLVIQAGLSLFLHCLCEQFDHVHFCDLLFHILLHQGWGHVRLAALLHRLFLLLLLQLLLHWLDIHGLLQGQNHFLFLDATVTY